MSCTGIRRINPKPIKRSIPTRYRSDVMRSRLEAKWAKAFDLLGIEYYYEPQLYFFDSIGYLPDFYLPQQDIFFEAKGVMDKNDVRKINALALGTHKDIVIGYPNGTFQMVDMLNYSEDEMMIYGADWNNNEQWWVSKEETILAKCEKCRKWHFHNEIMSWTCRIPDCGEWSKYWPLGFHQGSANLFEELEVEL